MKTWLTRLYALAWLCPALSWAAPPAAEAFFNDPLFSHAVLSPDGRKVAFLVGAAKARMRVGVLDLQTLKPDVVASFDDRDVRRVYWVNDQRLVLDLKSELVRKGRVDAGPGLFAVNADGTGFRALIETQRSFVTGPPAGTPLLSWNTVLTDVPGRATGNDIFVARAQEVSRQKVDHIAVERLDTVTGRVKEVDLPLHTVRWALDGQGDVRAVLTESAGRQAMHLRQADGAWQQLAEFEALGGDGMVPLWVGPDDTVYVQAPIGDKAAVFALDTATGKPRQPALASRGSRRWQAPRNSTCRPTSSPTTGSCWACATPSTPR